MSHSKRSFPRCPALFSVQPGEDAFFRQTKRHAVVSFCFPGRNCIPQALPARLTKQASLLSPKNGSVLPWYVDVDAGPATRCILSQNQRMYTRVTHECRREPCMGGNAVDDRSAHSEQNYQPFSKRSPKTNPLNPPSLEPHYL